MEGYEIERIVGEGSYGKAILAKNKKDHKKVIIKQINIKKLSSREVSYAKQEVHILERLKHPNIVRFIDTFNTRGNEALCIVMEYADGGDLDQFIKSYNRLITEDKVLDIFSQLCLAIKHIHDRKILHRDLKAKNIFLTKQGLVKVGDFGVSKVLRLTGEFAATCIGTPIYMSPEVINNNKYNSKSDIWSLGCILYELMCLKLPFTGGSLQQLYKNIASQAITLPSTQHYSRDLIVITKAMLEKSPKMRPGISSILKQPVLKSRLDMYVDQFKIQQEFCHTVLHGKHLMQEKRIPPDNVPIASPQIPLKEVKREVPPPPAINPFSPLLNKPKEVDPVAAYQALLDRARAEERARREKLAADQRRIENIQKQKREEMEKEKRRQRLLQEERELQKLKQIRQHNQQIMAALDLNKKKPRDLLDAIYGGPAGVKNAVKADKVPVRVARAEKVEDKAVREYDKPWIQAVKQQYDHDKVRKNKPSSNNKARENVLAKNEVARLKDDSSDSSKDEKVKNVKEKIAEIPKDRQVVGKWLESLQQKMNVLKNDVIAMKKAPSDIALNPGLPLKNPRDDQSENSPMMSPKQINKVAKKKSSEKSKPAIKKNPSRKSLSPEPDRKEVLQNRKVVREQKRAGFQDFLKQQKLAAKQAAPSPLLLGNDLGMPSVDTFVGNSPDYEYEKSPAIVDVPRKKISKISSNQALLQKKEKLSLEEFKALKNKERVEMLAFLKQLPGAGPSPLDGGPSVELHYHGKKTKSPKEHLVLESIDANELSRHRIATILSKESPIKPISLADLRESNDHEVTAEMRFQQTLYSDHNATTTGEPPMMFQRTLYSDHNATTTGEPPMMFQRTLYSDHNASGEPAMMFQCTLYSDHNASGEPAMMFQRTLYSDHNASGGVPVEPGMMFQQTLYSSQHDSNFDTKSSRQMMAQQTLHEQEGCVQESPFSLPNDHSKKWTSPILRIGDDDEDDNDVDDDDDVDLDEYAYYLQQKQDEIEQENQQNQPPIETISNDSDNDNDNNISIVPLNPFIELPNDDDAINAILNEDRNAIYKQIESILGNMPDDVNNKNDNDDDDSFEEEDDDDIFNDDVDYHDDRNNFDDNNYRIENSNINDSSFDISKFHDDDDDDNDNDKVEQSIEIIDDGNDNDSFHSSTFEEDDRDDLDDNDNDNSFISLNNNNDDDDDDKDPLMKARQLNNDDIKMQKIWQQLSHQLGQDVLMRAVNYIKGNCSNNNNNDDDDDKFLTSLQYIIGVKSIELFTADLYDLVLLMEP